MKLLIYSVKRAVDMLLESSWLSFNILDCLRSLLVQLFYNEDELFDLELLALYFAILVLDLARGDV